MGAYVIRGGHHRVSVAKARRTHDQRDRLRRLAVALSRGDLGERLRRRMNARDQVERAGQQLQRDESHDLRDLLIAVAVLVQALEVRVADLRRRRKHLLRKRDDRRDRWVARRALAREPDLAVSGTPSRRAARVCASKQ
jgi:hypothetical protein